MASNPKTAEGPDQPMTGTEYFKRCLGSEAHKSLTGLGKHNGAHPVTIRRVYEEAKALHPAAADVIAALVFWNATDRNRDDFLRSVNLSELHALVGELLNRSPGFEWVAVDRETFNKLRRLHGGDAP